jgi:hypothetical protein
VEVIVHLKLTHFVVSDGTRYPVAPEIRGMVEECVEAHQSQLMPTELVACDGTVFAIEDYGSWEVACEAIEDYERALVDEDDTPPEGP